MTTGKVRDLEPGKQIESVRLFVAAINTMRSNIDPSSCILVEDAKVIAADDQMSRDSTASVQTPTEGKYSAVLFLSKTIFYFKPDGKFMVSYKNYLSV